MNEEESGFLIDVLMSNFEVVNCLSIGEVDL